MSSWPSSVIFSQYSRWPKAIHPTKKAYNWLFLDNCIALVIGCNPGVLFMSCTSQLWNEVQSIIHLGRQEREPESESQNPSTNLEKGTQQELLQHITCLFFCLKNPPEGRPPKKRKDTSTCLKGLSYPANFLAKICLVLKHQRRICRQSPWLGLETPSQVNPTHWEGRGANTGRVQNYLFSEHSTLILLQGAGKWHSAFKENM